MQLFDVTYRGPQIDDGELLDLVPAALRSLLENTNGFIQYGGGLHVRGACREPRWHSLRTVWRGPDALHHLYPQVLAEDVPFAQNCVGDQFLLRGLAVHRLDAEWGDVTDLDLELEAFLARAALDPVEFLDLHPLLDYRERGGALTPGKLVLAYPPLCTEQSEKQLSLNAMPAGQVIRFHARLAAHIANLAPGAPFEIAFVD